MAQDRNTDDITAEKAEELGIDERFLTLLNEGRQAIRNQLAEINELKRAEQNLNQRIKALEDIINARP